MNRRTLLQTSAFGTLFARWPFSRASAATHSSSNLYQELGMRPIVNFRGTHTVIGASKVWPEIHEAMAEASRYYVDLEELQDKVGERLAKLIGTPDAMVTTGTAGAMGLGTCACLTGSDVAKVRQLPNLEGMKTEVIIQKAHRYGYDHAVRNCGTHFVEVETREQLENAINGNTVMMLFFNAATPPAPIKADEFAQLGKKHGIPTFNDAAADVPPVSHLSDYIKMGFDLVTFSGGKGIRGPQSAGLLLGRKDLIQAARMNASPNSDAIGRGMKVNKEELVGMMAAVEAYIKKDHEAEWRDWEGRVKTIADSVGPVSSVKAERFVPEISNSVPHLRITWDESQLKITAAEATRKLLEGNPSIELRPGAQQGIEVAVWMMQPGEAQIVARRIREVLKGAA